MRNLPFNAMRIFEAAARHKSFTRAAEELNITQTAVSKQVAKLEEFLGRPLFLRFHRSLELTEAGQAIARGTAEGMLHIEKTIHRLDQPAPNRVTILADVDVARLWLFPLLPEFEQRHPEVQISLVTKNFTAPILEEEHFDIAVSWGMGNWDNTLFEPLTANEAFPVCAPGYFGTRQPSLSALAPEELIHDRTTDWWRVFLDRAGAHDISSEFGRIFTQTSLCLEAAARGDGVTIGDEMSTRHYLQNGQLIAPFRDRIPSPNAYYLLYRERMGAAQDGIAVFRAWILNKAAQHRMWYSDFWTQQAMNK